MGSDYLVAFHGGLSNLLSWPGLIIPVIGTLVAMTASFLPGVGISSLSAILILWTINWEPVDVLLLFGALTGGATFMGSITGILFNIPGNTSSAVILLDGYKLSRNGYPRTAIAAAALSSAAGSVVGVLVLLMLLPFLERFILEFGPLERVLLGLWGLSTIAAIPNTSTIKAIAVSCIGLILAMIGTEPASAAPRWTFGALELLGGLSVISVLLGYFTFSEVVCWHRGYTISSLPQQNADRDSVLAGLRAVLKHRWLALRCSVLGTLVGIIPGVGGTVAGFVAYGHAVQSAKEGKENFGKGDIRGVIGPEASVDAKDGGSLLPAIAFGLPGSEAGVILVAVLSIHGLTPGTPMLTVDLALTFTLILALLMSNFLTSVFGIAAAPALARLSALPIYRIALPVMVASLLSILHINGSLVDLYVAIFMGIIGFLLQHFGWPRIPLVIAFVLGDFFESNLSIATRLASLGRLDVWDRPSAILLAALIALSLFWMLRSRRTSVEEVAAQPYAVAFSAVLVAVALGIAVTSFLSPGYSLYAKGIAVASVFILSVIAIKEARTSSCRNTSREGPIGIPKMVASSLAILAALPLTVWALGVSFSISLLTFAWVAQRRKFDFRSLFIPMVLAGALFIASHIYFKFWSNLLLPVPALWNLSR